MELGAGGNTPALIKLDQAQPPVVFVKADFIRNGDFRAPATGLIALPLKPSLASDLDQVAARPMIIVIDLDDLALDVTVGAVRGRAEIIGPDHVADLELIFELKHLICS